MTDIDIPRDASGLLASLMDQFEKCWNAMVDMGEPLSREEQRVISNRIVDVFGQTFLLACLRRVDPDGADRAAAWLADQWGSGDALGEWEFQWRRETALGRPLTLRGFEGGGPGAA
jgi:hypothetical protein